MRLDEIRLKKDNLVAQMGDEGNLALRIKDLMKEKGWSQTRLSKEMESAGHPIHQTAISKIVNPPKGDGRRSVTVQEAIGFAKVFDIDLEDLVVPSFALVSKRVAGLIARGPGELRGMLLAQASYADTVTDVATSMISDEAVASSVIGQYETALEGRSAREIEDSVNLGFLGDVCREYEQLAVGLGIQPVTGAMPKYTSVTSNVYHPRPKGRIPDPATDERKKADQ